VRLEITRKTDLASRVLVELSNDGGRLKAGVLADRVGSTPGFLSQVVAPLVERGWVRSDPGPTGGYQATVSLDEVSVLDLVEAVEGPTDAGRCVLVDRPCTEKGLCALHTPWMKARAGLLADLAATPLSTIPVPDGDENRRTT
jgi:Rrf2 family protein